MPKISLLELSELEDVEPEMVPEILPVDARLAVRGPTLRFIRLFERAAAVTPLREEIPGTGFAMLEVIAPTKDAVASARITATDGQQTVSAVIDGIRVSMAGSVLLPPKRFLDILKKAPSDQVAITVLGSHATIQAGRAVWTVQTPVASELGQLPTLGEIELHTVAVKPFLRVLTNVRRAVAVGGRPALNQIQLMDGKLTATDGGKVLRIDMPDLDPDLDMGIPVRVADELIRALRETAQENLLLGTDNTHLVFQLGDESIIASRLLLRFPDISNLLLGPAFTNTLKLTVDKAELLAAVVRMRINADPDNASLGLAVVAADGDWALSVRTRDRIGNTGQELIECQWTGTKAREWSLNHHHLTDFLASYSGDILDFFVGEDTKTVRYPLYLEDSSIGFVGVLQQLVSVW